MSDLVYANAAVSAHMATYGLNQPRINALIRARGEVNVIALLNEIGYDTKNLTGGCVDTMINVEREKAFKKFEGYCDCSALLTCVRILHEFRTTKIDAEKLQRLERNLSKTVSRHVDAIRYAPAREYFNEVLSSFRTQKKINESALFNIASNMRFDNTTIGPIFYWWVLKQSEFAVIKTILMMARFGSSHDEILQTLKSEGLYERF